jgi:uncharacterized protein
MADSPGQKSAGSQAIHARGLPKALIAFWVGFAVIALGGIGVLQYLGPPPAPLLPAADIHHGGGAGIAPAALVVKTAAELPVAGTPAPPALPEIGTGSMLALGQAIPAPVPAMLAPSATNPNWLVPHIAPNGMAPMRAYAGAIVSGPGPHVAVLVAGIGDDDSQSQEAVTTLPAAVSLAITPYCQHIADIAALARASGHELLLAIPMQETDPATENAGDEALVMAGPIMQNQPMLDWSLSQFQGYAGVTDAIGVTQGAGFMDNSVAKAWLLQEIADKGLFFIDARQTGAAPYAWNRTADVVIDPIRAPDQESAQLAELAADARLQGDALGILLNPAPGALLTLANWTQTLAGQGITLVPVSALVLPPIGFSPTTAAAVIP